MLDSEAERVKGIEPSWLEWLFLEVDFGCFTIEMVVDDCGVAYSSLQFRMNKVDHGLQIFERAKDPEPLSFGVVITNQPIEPTLYVPKSQAIFAIWKLDHKNISRGRIGCIGLDNFPDQNRPD